MLRWFSHRITLFFKWLVSFWDVLFPFSDCPIGWSPNALAPVFYGTRDYSAADGAPGPCRVFFPSIDGSPQSAEILRCGRYPLILFGHGHCDEPEHYKKWFVLPASLARSGYVVVVPEIPDIRTGPASNEAGMTRIRETIRWMRTGWEFRSVLMPAPHTGILGHSFGAVLTARYAAESITTTTDPHPFLRPILTPRRYSIRAYASIDGVHTNWSGSDFPAQRITVPKLFCYGTGPGNLTIGVDIAGLWNGISAPKHKAAFKDAEHWDWLSAGSTTCERDRGPCGLTQRLSIELVLMFFAKYLPPEKSPDLPSRIDDTLIPPALTLNADQEFYAGNHLGTFPDLSPGGDCEVELEWSTGYSEGAITVP